MTEEDESPAGPADASLAAHPVRRALLDLLAELGTVTSTEAARRLGHSSGLCSFHLRQLARHGLIEEAPHPGGGRVRPWRLRAPAEPADEDFAVLARGLEDESYQRWLAHREAAPEEWRRDEAFSAVVHLTPDELARLGEQIRALLAPYADRRGRPAAAAPVAAIARLFPLVAPKDE
ncbi:winged helix-turn-helix domain-containing protein [Streptomyces millisiae]|uniref:Helix-turn-helix domain-containing protein n=1 Tax=Streptomyces millisiae TaxID=3075542 RepID=A0ABU2LWT6_9ACTN|nr:helix-turn-helix domain-containing protein [Streptomyces sp. DSM 44918]MDT0321738.1 helix-turn-helix domain-containing protein [Streptomyces sp. DSM 44918]